jgi:transcriptional regulator with XRE-family HTH domain
MALADLLVPTVKRLLRAKRLTYRDVAAMLELTEASVKRLFASKRLSLAQVERLSELLGMNTVELIEASEATAPRVRALTRKQEAALVANEKLLLVTVCVINHWTLADIVASYAITEAECVRHALVLDKIGIIQLYPGNRIRLLLARDFDWLDDGPIRQFLRVKAIPDFIAGSFNKAPYDALTFGHGMLTQTGRQQLQAELERLKVRLAALHEASSKAPLAEKSGIALLLATRSWEPASFANLRRRTDDADVS